MILFRSARGARGQLGRCSLEKQQSCVHAVVRGRICAPTAGSSFTPPGGNHRSAGRGAKMPLRRARTSGGEGSSAMHLSGIPALHLDPFGPEARIMPALLIDPAETIRTSARAGYSADRSGRSGAANQCFWASWGSGNPSSRRLRPGLGGEGQSTSVTAVPSGQPMAPPRPMAAKPVIRADATSAGVQLGEPRGGPIADAGSPSSMARWRSLCSLGQPDRAGR